MAAGRSAPRPDRPAASILGDHNAPFWRYSLVSHTPPDLLIPLCGSKWRALGCPGQEGLKGRQRAAQGF